MRTPGVVPVGHRGPTDSLMYRNDCASNTLSQRALGHGACFGTPSGDLSAHTIRSPRYLEDTVITFAALTGTLLPLLLTQSPVRVDTGHVTAASARFDAPVVP